MKEKMEGYAGVVNWAEGSGKKWIAQRVEELERVRAVEEAVRLLENIAHASRGTARLLVRENRDSH